MSFRRTTQALLAVMAFVLAGCNQTTVSPTPSSASTERICRTVRSRARRPLAVGLGFIESVQFAQFYRADQAGYYGEAGLDVTFRHGFDYDRDRVGRTGSSSTSASPTGRASSRR